LNTPLCALTEKIVLSPVEFSRRLIIEKPAVLAVILALLYVEEQSDTGANLKGLAENVIPARFLVMLAMVLFVSRRGALKLLEGQLPESPESEVAFFQALAKFFAKFQSAPPKLFVGVVDRNL